MNRLFTGLAFAAGLTLSSVTSYAQTPIASLPYTVSSGGNYYLTQNLTYSGAAGNAITVNASNVTIDLNGYQLFSPNSNNSVGIYGNNASNVSIKNGAIAGFTFAIEFGLPGGGSNANFGHLVDGVRFMYDEEAVLFYVTRGCVVRNCQIEGGLYGIAFDNGAGNRASNNVATGTGYGFYSSGADYFDSNYADSCTYAGIYVQSAVTKLRFNTTTNCGVAVYGGTSEGSSDQ